MVGIACPYCGWVHDDYPCPSKNTYPEKSGKTKMENPDFKPSLKDKLEEIQKEHEDQFALAVAAALKRGFQRWFDDTWTSARASGANPHPFISSMFVFFTTVLMKKFVSTLPEDMAMADKEERIAGAALLLKGYIDQIEAAGMKDLYKPKSDRPPEPPKQTIILPEKKKFRH